MKFRGDELIVRDYLALDRTYLANTRTLLAYIRSGVALFASGLGMVELIDRYFIALLGYVFMFASPIFIAAGIVGYFKVRRRWHWMGDTYCIPPEEIK